jgi:hypothetical protein
MKWCTLSVVIPRVVRRDCNFLSNGGGGGGVDAGRPQSSSGLAGLEEGAGQPQEAIDAGHRSISLHNRRYLSPHSAYPRIPSEVKYVVRCFKEVSERHFGSLRF